jgi:hypothetical protein
MRPDTASFCLVEQKVVIFDSKKLAAENLNPQFRQQFILSALVSCQKEIDAATTSQFMI